MFNLPGYYPDGGEDDQHRLAGPAVLGVPEQFGQLQQRISAVVDDEDESSYSDKVSCPAEHDEGDGGLVVNEHLPEVLPLDIKELAEGKRPVESHLHHVIKPNVSGDFVPGVLHEAAIYVPEPVFRPEHYQPVDEYEGVEDKSPASLAKFF